MTLCVLEFISIRHTAYKTAQQFRFEQSEFVRSSQELSEQSRAEKLQTLHNEICSDPGRPCCIDSNKFCSRKQRVCRWGWRLGKTKSRTGKFWIFLVVHLSPIGPTYASKRFHKNHLGMFIWSCFIIPPWRNSNLLFYSQYKNALNRSFKLKATI